MNDPLEFAQPARSSDPEQLRVQTLHSLQLLDTSAEQEYDDLVQLAAAICGTPIAFLSLVDTERQWFKAATGIDFRETPRKGSFCHHAIQQPSLFVVPDAHADERFASSFLVTGDPHVRFYAGMPLQAPNGHTVGALCVYDTVPRELTAQQSDAMRVLSTQIQTRLELRARQIELESSLKRLKHITAMLKESEERFRLFMDNGPFCAYIKDQQGRILYYNQHLANTFQITRKTWLYRTNHDLFAPELADQFVRHDRTVLDAGVPTVFDEQTFGADGQPVHWKSVKFPYRGAGGDVMLAGVSIDITAEVRQRKQLETANTLLQNLSITDGLTGLVNRRCFQEKLELEFTRARRNQRDLALVMIDIDNFKRCNDTYGHTAGDAVLRQVGEVLHASIRSIDVAARFGGEEFALILPEATIDTATQLCQRLRRNLAARTWAGDPVTVSIGISMLTPESPTSEHLILAADAALYQAKAAGKDTFRVLSLPLPSPSLPLMQQAS